MRVLALHYLPHGLSGWERAAQDIILFGALCAVVYKWPGKAIRKRWATRRQLQADTHTILFKTIPTLLHAHDDMDVKFDKVLAELEPNSGTSLRDAVNRIEKQLSLTHTISMAHLDFDNRPMYMTNIDNELVWVNHALSALAQRDVKDLLGKNYYSIFPEKDRAQLVKQVEALAKQDAGNILTFDLVVNDAERTVISVVANTIHMKDAAGNRVGSFGYLEVPTNRRKGEHDAR